MNLKAESPETPVFALCEMMSEIVCALVDDPGQVAVEILGPDGNDPVLLICVGRDDHDRLTGQKGRILNALRTFVNAISAKHPSRIRLQIRALR